MEQGELTLENKHSEIETLIGNYHPHVLGLCEANLRSNVDISLVSHQDYNIHVAKTLSHPEPGVARAVVYTHTSLAVKRREDLEDTSLSAVWLELGLPRQRKILIATFYREWQHLVTRTRGAWLLSSGGSTSTSTCFSFCTVSRPVLLPSLTSNSTT